MYGEDDTSPKAVAQLVVVCFVAQSGLDEKLFPVSFLKRFLCHGVVAVGAVAQLELLDDVVPEPSVAEVCHADAAPVHVVAQDVLEVVAGKLVDDEKTFPFALHQFFFVGQFPFLNLDAVFLCKVLQRLGIGHLLVLHDEVHRIAPFAAGKAFAQSLGGRYVERGGLVVVKRAKPHVVHSALAQGDEVGYDVYDWRRIQNPVYGGLVYHDSCTNLHIKSAPAKKSFARAGIRFHLK